jgi:hypothetical protein
MPARCIAPNFGDLDFGFLNAILSKISQAGRDCFPHSHGWMCLANGHQRYVVNALT